MSISRRFKSVSFRRMLSSRVTRILLSERVFKTLIFATFLHTFVHDLQDQSLIKKKRILVSNESFEKRAIASKHISPTWKIKSSCELHNNLLLTTESF